MRARMVKGAMVVAAMIFVPILALAQGNAAKGKELYTKNCAGCHGPAGKGDGPAAAALNPKPTDFTNKAYMAGLKRCYKNYLKKDPTARGKLELALTVNETGRTINGKAKGLVPEVDDCVNGLMGSWRFPIPKDKDGEATEASFSITLQLVPD